MSFAGFGTALGNLFGGVAGSLQEQEKLRMAREFQAKQMEDMGAQMEERKAIAAYRLAEAERQKQLASPETQGLIKLAMSGGEGSDDATARLIAMDASRFGTLLKPKTLSPVNRQQATIKGPNGEPMAVSFDPATGKHYDAAGGEIKNPIAYYAPSMVGTVTPQQQHAAAREDVNTIVKMMPRPSQVQKNVLDLTAKPAAMKPNPLYTQAIADSLNMQRTQLDPALAELARTSQGMGVGRSTPNVPTMPTPVVPLPPTSQTGTPALPPSVNRSKYNTDADYRAFINQTLNIKP